MAIHRILNVHIREVKVMERLPVPPNNQATMFENVKITMFIAISIKIIVNVPDTNSLKFINVEHSSVKYKQCFVLTP